MVPLIVFAAIVGVPILLALILRVNAIFVFMSIAAGYLLQMSLSGSVDLLVAVLVKGSNSLLIARVLLFALPVVLTLFLLRRTVGRSMVFQIVPLIFSGMMFGALMLPLLSPAFSQSVYDSQYGGNIRSAGDLVTAIAVASNMILTFMLFKAAGGHKKKHH